MSRRVATDGHERATRPTEIRVGSGVGALAWPPFEVWDSKLHPPIPRAEIVERKVLLRRLRASSAPFLSIVAPPGYGKTTLLSQWVETTESPVAWVSVDERDNDPSVLLAHVATAVNRIEPLDDGFLRLVTSPRSGAALRAVHRLASTFSDLSRPLSVVLDQCEALSNQECFDLLAELSMSLGEDSRVAIASRTVPPLPIALMRSRGQLDEFGFDDLAMDEHEAEELFDQFGLQLTSDEVRDLVRRTEGWPVGLYLAALAHEGERHSRGAVVRFSDDDQLIADYLRSELLGRISPQEVTFLTRTSVLERMSGPLCDEVVGRGGSALLLEEMERRNLLIVPLDRHREWYRYHHLLRHMLRRELDRREPGSIEDMHVRAASWFERNGRPELALSHAQEAGDADAVARLVLDLAQPVWASGRVDTVMSWMRWLEEKKLVELYPAVAVHGALIFALLGQPGTCDRWATAADVASPDAEIPDGSTMDSYLAYLRANLCRDGIEEMRGDSLRALEGLSPASPYRATMTFTAGLSDLLEGDPDRADAGFVPAFDATMHAGQLPFAAVILAERCIAAAERGDWSETEELTSQAVSMVQDGGLDDYWTSAVVYAWAAREALHRGKITKGRDFVTRAARLRGLLTYALPVVSVQTLIELARSYVALGDRDGAKTVLRQATDIIRVRPMLGQLPDQVEQVRRMVERIPVGNMGASSLTGAELRLLPYLSTHLTFGEIADRLYVTHSTVKTQTTSIYRKLGVSSRSAAIEKLTEAGLLGS
jgi:LuxR family transcriptional regulator, maltose regulon positive regulatory protein